MSKFVIKKAKDGEFQFNLKADNGKIILSSEMYKSKSSCINGITSVQNYCTDSGNYERKVSLNKKHFFVIKLTCRSSVTALHIIGKDLKLRL